MSSENGGRFSMLSFDHRNSFERELLGITTEPDADAQAPISTRKEIIYPGFRQAVAGGAPKEQITLHHCIQGWPGSRNGAVCPSPS